MKGNFGKKTFSLKRTATGITIYGVMGRINTKPANVRTRINSHGITSHITKEMEEKRYEHKYK